MAAAVEASERAFGKLEHQDYLIWESWSCREEMTELNLPDNQAFKSGRAKAPAAVSARPEKPDLFFSGAGLVRRKERLASNPATSPPPIQLAGFAVRDCRRRLGTSIRCLKSAMSKLSRSRAAWLLLRS